MPRIAVLVLAAVLAAPPVSAQARHDDDEVSRRLAVLDANLSLIEERSSTARHLAGYGLLGVGIPVGLLGTSIVLEGGWLAFTGVPVAGLGLGLAIGGMVSLVSLPDEEALPAAWRQLSSASHSLRVARVHEGERILLQLADDAARSRRWTSAATVALGVAGILAGGGISGGAGLLVAGGVARWFVKSSAERSCEAYGAWRENHDLPSSLGDSWSLDVSPGLGGVTVASRF